MSEAWVPVPPPEPDDYLDISPARCGECGVLLQNPHPASRKDGRWEGWCPTHGTVVCHYGALSQKSEKGASNG